LDTDATCTRIVSDSWIEIVIKDQDAAQSFITSTLLLRKSWDRLLNIRINAHTIKKSEEDDKVDPQKGREIIKLQRYLADKISEFLDSKIDYRLRRLTGTEKQNLYVGPGPVDDLDITKNSLGVPMSNGTPNQVKGGISLSTFLTYNCLQAFGSGQLKMVGSEHLREFWTCPTCQLKLPMTVSERIRHQAACGQDDVIKSEEAHGKDEEEDQEEVGARLYYCKVCEEEMKMTAIQILKHKRSHVKDQTL